MYGVSSSGRLIVHRIPHMSRALLYASRDLSTPWRIRQPIGLDYQCDPTDHSCNSKKKHNRSSVSGTSDVNVGRVFTCGRSRQAFRNLCSQERDIQSGSTCDAWGWIRDEASATSHQKLTRLPGKFHVSKFNVPFVLHKF